MKVLCLAGYGSSGRVFEKQTQQLRRLLPESTEYVFTEGEIECSRHPSKSISRPMYCADNPAIPEAMPGPFYCWYKRVEPGPIRLAHELLYEVIEEEGPFDGVIAFSQGAALVMSMLMDHEINNAGARPLFGFAALFSCPIALSPDTKLNREVLRTATSKDGSEKAQDKTTDKAAPKHRFSLLLPENQLALAKDIGVKDLSDSESGSDDAEEDESDDELSHIPRLYHPLMVTARVSVPTVHLYDPNEAYARQFKFVTRLCDKFLMQEVSHSGGHGVPSEPKEVKACAAAIVKAMEKGRQRINMF
jgi:hypothetical protein